MGRSHGALMRFWVLDESSWQNWCPFEFNPWLDQDPPDGPWDALNELPRGRRHYQSRWLVFYWGDRHRSDILDRTWKRHRSHQHKVIDMTKSVYKIRRRSDGMFSSGSACPGFTAVGKTWSGCGPLKNHLRMIAQNHSREGMDRLREVYADCEVVEYAIISPEVEAVSIENFLESD